MAGTIRAIRQGFVEPCQVQCQNLGERDNRRSFPVSKDSNTATNQETERQRQAKSGVELSKQELKALYQRSDTKGLIYFGGWLALTSAAGFLYYLSLPTYWVVPALMLYSTLLALGYAMSHETTHGTAFRTRWLNEAVFWFTSLIYGHEPYHRRYSHASHHTHTEIRGVDAQKPWNHPMTLWDYIKKLSGIGEVMGFPRILFPHAVGHIPERVKVYTPQSERPNLIWGARAFLAIHAGFIGAFALAGLWWIPFVFFYIPRLVGGPLANNVFDMTQHAEMKEDVLDMRENTRSVKTTWWTNFIYSNMSYHCEHHLYPLVPFHALPALNEKVREHLPEPGRGFYRTNVEILRTIFARMQKSQTRDEPVA